jgi:RhtB (resistance to homoserine/threonine) family protein
MEYFSLIGLVFITHLLAVMSPGPDFLMVIKNAMQYNRKIAVYTALGISIGIGVHITYSLAGVAYILKHNEKVFNSIKIIGALYIIYIGVKIWLNQKKEIISNQNQNLRLISARQAIKMGFFTNILNPKVSLFFLSLFSVVIPQNTPHWLLLLISLMLIFITFLWFSFISFALTTPKSLQVYQKYELIIAKLFAVMLVTLGLSILF